MNSGRPSEDEVFEKAQELSGAARAAYLREAAGDDAELRQRIEKLLQAGEKAGDFLNQPAAERAGTLVTAPGPVPVTEQPGDKIGRYKLRERIGEGGCGVVYVAEQEEPVRRRVALKIIKLGMDTRQVVARFEAERQALALMDHPNIAKVLDAGATDTGRPYFVMELVRGIRITDYCDKNNLSTEERLKLFMQVCVAIQHAHQKGIIHRDIKPSNILVTLHDGVPVPMVIDFGIAKATTDQRLTDKTVYTAFEQFIGTPAYMSPEQAEMSGLDIDTRSDIYSLGVLLYELLTGRTPFDAATLLKAGLDQMRRIIREQEPQRPSTRLSTLTAADLTAVAGHHRAEPPKLIKLIRGDLDWIVMRALEKDRTRRFETVSALALDVQRHLENEPVVSRPPSQVYRLRKLVQRNKVVFGAIASVAIALAMGLSASVWLAIRATRAERAQSLLRAQAERERLRAEVERNGAELQAETAKRERNRADEHTRMALDTLQQMKMQRAEDFFRADNTSLALALLAQILRQDPSNQAAAERIMAALTQRSFLLPRYQWLASTRMAEFSPDGGRLACVDADNRLSILDARTGQAMAGPVLLSDGLHTLEFSPDGTQLLTACSNQVSYWNPGNLVRARESIAFPSPIYSAHFTAHGPRLISLQGSTVTVLDGVSGSALFGPLHHGSQHRRVEFVSFSRDGNRLIVVLPNSNVRLWNATNGAPITDVLDAGGSGPSVALSSDGRAFVVGSWGSHVGYCYDTGVTPVQRFAFNHPACVPCVAFNPDGRSVATGADDGIARIWETGTGKLVSDSIRRDGGIRTVQFDPGGRRLLTSSTDRTIRLWDAGDGRPLTEALRTDLDGWPDVLKVSPDGSSVLVIAETNCQIWDLRPGRALAEPEWNAQDSREDRLSPDGRLEVKLEGYYNGAPTQARLIERRTQKPLSERFYFEANVFAARFSPDGQRFALGIGKVNGEARGRAEVFDAGTGARLREFVIDDWAVTCLAFSPDGRRIATGSHRGEAQIWEVDTGKPLTTPLDIGGSVEGVTFSPDGRWLLTRADARTARVWNATNGTNLLALRHNGQIHHAGFSADGKLIVTAGEDKTARIWDASTGKMLHDLRHESSVLRALFSPDGRKLATGTRDGVVRVWSAGTGQPITEPLRPPKLANDYGVHFLQFADGGKRLRTGSRGKVVLWDVPSAPIPAPAWLADLAEVVGGQRLGEGMQVESVSSQRLLALKRQMETNENLSTDPYLQWAKWFFANRTTRTVSPLSQVAVRDYIRHCAKGDSNGSFELDAAEHLAGGEAELVRGIPEERARLQQLQEASTLEDRADVFWEQNNLDEAEAAFRKALAIRKKFSQEEKEGLASTAYSLANLLHYRRGGLAEAESLYREALGIFRNLWGNEHHKVADTLDELARVLQAQDKLEEAESSLREVVKIRFGGVDNKQGSPYERWYPDSITRLASVLRRAGRADKLEALYADMLKGGSKDWLNEIAWRLATSKRLELRDGRGAVSLAEKAVEMTGRKDPNLVDTLAAAHAEAGDFEKAVSVQKEAISLLSAKEQTDDYTSRLKLYEAHTAYRQEG